MAENLKTTHYRNNEPIPNVQNTNDWGNLQTGAYCDYLNNKNKYTESRKLNREKHKIWLADYKKTLSCETCGENHPACLDFHHIDPSLKEDSINRIKQRYSLEYLKKEIEKCKVLCSNCHRIRTWKRNNASIA